jgi:hypothetical protein
MIAAHVEQHFDRVWPWIEAALQRDVQTHGKGDIRAMLLSGEAQLWPGENCALVTVVQRFPLTSICVAWLAGGDLSQIVQLAPAIEAWAKSVGCSHSQIAARRGWLKALTGYREAGALMIKEL